MPYKPMPCSNQNCTKLCQRGGRKGATGLCWECWRKAGLPKPKTKPLPHQQYQSEQAKDRAARHPTSSWWTGAPRESWGSVVEAQRRDRFQAGGCGVEKSQRPIGAE